MIDRARIHLTVLLAACGALVACGSALAASGGASTSATGTPAGSSSAVGDGARTVSASGDGVSFSTRVSATLRGRTSFSGRAPAADAGRRLEVERLGRETGWAWRGTTHATIASDGSFIATWAANHIGQFAIRVVILGRRAHAAAASPSVSIVVYRPSVASWYGPGFFGHRTACGVRLTRHTLGVANRSLRCGTRVALIYRGRTLTVPVIDRGPYARGVDWDLTQATRLALGLTGTTTIGAASLTAPRG